MTAAWSYTPAASPRPASSSFCPRFWRPTGRRAVPSLGRCGRRRRAHFPVPGGKPASRAAAAPDDQGAGRRNPASRQRRTLAWLRSQGPTVRSASWRNGWRSDQMCATWSRRRWIRRRCRLPLACLEEGQRHRRPGIGRYGCGKKARDRSGPCEPTRTAEEFRRPRHSEVRLHIAPN